MLGCGTVWSGSVMPVSWSRTSEASKMVGSRLLWRPPLGDAEVAADTTESRSESSADDADDERAGDDEDAAESWAGEWRVCRGFVSQGYRPLLPYCVSTRWRATTYLRLHLVAVKAVRNGFRAPLLLRRRQHRAVALGSQVRNRSPLEWQLRLLDDGSQPLRGHAHRRQLAAGKELLPEGWRRSVGI